MYLTFVRFRTLLALERGVRPLKDNQSLIFKKFSHLEGSVRIFLTGSNHCQTNLGKKLEPRP